MTSFRTIYGRFLSKITDDMYMELTPEETEAMAQELLMSAIPMFEFPRFDLFDYDLELEEFNCDLSAEEQNILATYMVVEWIGKQLAIIDLIRMQYSGVDFKFTSQANHITKLQSLKRDYERMGFHLQRLYKRRKKNSKGIYLSTIREIMGDYKQ